jgi:hypothetical protein
MIVEVREDLIKPRESSILRLGYPTTEAIVD